jgi:hypothetical protein
VQGAPEAFPVSHYANGTVHGAVRLFVADDGRMAIFCEVDGMGWTLEAHASMEHYAVPLAVPQSNDQVVGMRDSEAAPMTHPDDTAATFHELSPRSPALHFDTVQAVRKLWH